MNYSSMPQFIRLYLYLILFAIAHTKPYEAIYFIADVFCCIILFAI